MKVNNSLPIISEMTQEEVQDITLNWAKQEGWNPGLSDAHSFYIQDPKGFFVARLNGEPIGCASAVIYDDSFAFFGLYIVKPEYRHRGFGMALTDHCLEYVGDRNCGLDGVVEMVDKYAELGFKLAHYNISYQGVIPVNTTINSAIVEITEEHLPRIEAYDRLHFPAPRSKFLRLWLKSSTKNSAFTYLEEGEVKGFGAIRRCSHGYKIGPLFADTYAVAEALFQRLAAEAEGGVVFLNIPEPNIKASLLVNLHQMEPCFKTARMYTKELPDLRLNQIFGVTTFELG